MTIQEVELRIPALLNALKSVKLTPELEEVRRFLLPPGFVPVIQLEEDGRKKRSSSAARNWNPETGNVRIYYDPAPAESPQKPLTVEVGPLPDFPITAISLSQTLPTVGVVPRFQPVPVRGEPVSITLLRDRGPA